MTMAFDFTTPRRVLFGCGRVAEAGGLAASFGKCAMVFAGQNPNRCETLLASLRKSAIDYSIYPVRGEPTFDVVRRLAAEAPGVKPDVIIAMGGGSVIDAAKAVAMLITNGGDPLDYAEVIGAGLPVNIPSLPFIAIPTTAGAGAEATRNAVLVDHTSRAKVSLRSHLMIPDTVIVDPQTTLSLPAAVTAETGMDAMAQLIEPFVSVRANPLTDAICRTGIERVARSLERACTHPDDLTAREDMSLAAWWSGVALANAGLGGVHGFAAALGGLGSAPHGLICARFLAPVCRKNIELIRTMPVDHPALIKFGELARIVTGRDNAQPDDLIVWLEALANRLPLGNLSDYRVRELNENEVISAAAKSSSMKGNPVSWSESDLRDVFLATVSG
ncbi:MAG TPA: iron-containing alcohol dehydrogenase [Kiritimatiellia bacterium]|nr:iron-containing alcohol dehydrogenase [Kiritimatiellia bacterium]